MHSRHEDPGATLRCRTLSPQALDFAITINFVVLEDSQLGLLALMLDLLRSGVNLLLPFLRTTTKAQHEVKG